MATARRRDMRRHAIEQAALVWGLGELVDGGAEHFVKCGEMVTKGDGTLPYMPEVEIKLAEIYANGGKLRV